MTAKNTTGTKAVTWGPAGYDFRADVRAGWPLGTVLAGAKRHLEALRAIKNRSQEVAAEISATSAFVAEAEEKQMQDQP